MKKLARLMSLIAALGCAGALAAGPPVDKVAQPQAAQGETTPDANNSAMNVRDKSRATKTPQNQTNRKEELKLLANVRRAIVKDKSLSISAHNVKVIVQDSVVTLRGPVKNEDEKGRIEALVKNVAGVASVANQLDLKTQ